MTATLSATKSKYGGSDSIGPRAALESSVAPGDSWPGLQPGWRGQVGHHRVKKRATCSSRWASRSELGQANSLFGEKKIIQSCKLTVHICHSDPSPQNLRQQRSGDEGRHFMNSPWLLWCWTPAYTDTCGQVLSGLPETGRRCVPCRPRSGAARVGQGRVLDERQGRVVEARFLRTSSSALVCSCHRKRQGTASGDGPSPSQMSPVTFFQDGHPSASFQIKCRWSKDPGFSCASSVSHEKNNKNKDAPSGIHIYLSIYSFFF